MRAAPVRDLADLLALALLVARRVVFPAAALLAAPVRFLVERDAVVRRADPAAVVLVAAPLRDFVDLPAALRAVVRVDVDFLTVRGFVVLAAISVGSFS